MPQRRHESGNMPRIGPRFSSETLRPGALPQVQQVSNFAQNDCTVSSKPKTLAKPSNVVAQLHNAGLFGPLRCLTPRQRLRLSNRPQAEATALGRALAIIGVERKRGFAGF